MRLGLSPGVSEKKSVKNQTLGQQLVLVGIKIIAQCTCVYGGSISSDVLVWGTEQQMDQQRLYPY